jgi:hypothetical protein
MPTTPLPALREFDPPMRRLPLDGGADGAGVVGVGQTAPDDRRADILPFVRSPRLPAAVGTCFPT